MSYFNHFAEFHVASRIVSEPTALAADCSPLRPIEIQALHPASARSRGQKGYQPANPPGAVDDQVERIELQVNTAFPITGVEGTAMSRGSIRPALKA